MYIKGDYRYRTIEEADLEWARKLHNDSEVLYMLTDTTMISEKQQLLWFESISSSTKSKRLILEYESKKIGLARLDEIDFLNRSICVGLDISSEFRGKGHGYNGFKLMLDYCFLELNMHRTWLLVAEFNKKAFALYRKLGFIEEGVQRERIFRNGKYHNYIMMSILEREYK